MYLAMKHYPDRGVVLVKLKLSTWLVEKPIEEKSLRQDAMIANFWMTTNQKRHLKSEFAPFQTSAILFDFI